ncbi:hypothetical protein [Agromyces seonyuensis]|uniref:Uncharacterized protein n=1 Tax=Agromyces seonyuensis TaxID=2662446 RepID=A0A6I4NYP5_9MICO|nr:hypothetical protein [Agromyces seonyuensis]MWB98312.1 hypothetical protein [Agromyces seonyuensis]
MTNTEVSTSTTRVLLNISDNQGYAPDQIETRVTLGDLLDAVTEAIREFGEGAVIVLSNGQRYGAGFGSISSTWDGAVEFEVSDADEDEEGEW